MSTIGRRRWKVLFALLLITQLAAVIGYHHGDLDETVEHIKIGGLFDGATEDVELAFQYAVEAVNNEKLSYSNYQLEAQAVQVKYGDQFDASKKLCRLLKTGVAGIFGPSSPKSALHVQSVCDEKEMPHIETRWDAVHVLLTGNERFEGFGIDLIHELSLMLGFNYTFILQEDGVYGSLNRDTKKWNGMVLELLEWRADLAITDLTITSDRESAVDFTMPFMNLGISILYRKPTKEPPSLFSFMSPFSKQVWLYLGGAYMMVSMSLFILGRISPKEWDNPYPCIEEPEELENQFSFSNSMWFTIGALLQQGSEIAPKAPATRAVASIWWFFTLIMVSSYTANLAAFLTVEQVVSPISNAEDLAAAGGTIKYGAKRDGSTISFFKDAEYGTYAKMYQYMMANQELLTSSNPEGLQRVKTENYAFLMESTSIEYIVERECDVTQIGGLLDDKGYGIAMRKNSPYRSALSEAVLRLQEQGVLTSLKRKWWKEKRGGGACSNTMEEGGALALELANVGGVFVLLIVGCVAALFVSFCEMLCEVHSRTRELKQSTSDDGAEELDMDNVGGVFFVLFVGCSFASLFGCCELFFVIAHRARRHKVPFREELMAELRFVAKCHGNTKPVRHRKSSSASGENSLELDVEDSTSSSKQDISGNGMGDRLPTGNQRRQNGGKLALNGNTRKMLSED
uniref:Ionotropic glutamate receptor C-terminal domain-containing protein n=1 Tax=Anopheles coluzzii TaxID=1518534 RepID=A0A8W7PVP5_ANOCL